MILDFDASVLAPLLIEDVHTTRARTLPSNGGALVASDFAQAKLTSVIARQVGTGELTRSDGLEAFKLFDAWADRAATKGIRSRDLLAATDIMRRLDLPLRTPDAIHVAVATGLGALLATFDRQLAASALRLGLALPE